jgi:hypothetical protein
MKAAAEMWVYETFGHLPGQWAFPDMIDMIWEVQCVGTTSTARLHHGLSCLVPLRTSTSWSRCLVQQVVVWPFYVANAAYHHQFV